MSIRILTAGTRIFKIQDVEEVHILRRAALTCNQILNFEFQNQKESRKVTSEEIEFVLIDLAPNFTLRTLLVQ